MTNKPVRDRARVVLANRGTWRKGNMATDNRQKFEVAKKFIDASQDDYFAA